MPGPPEKRSIEVNQMNDVPELERRLIVLERRVRLLTVACIALGSTALVGADRPSADVLRARGQLVPARP
jgi:hypothetical protein